MRRIQLIVLIFSTLSLIVIVGFGLVKVFRPKVSGLNISTTPSAGVYINGIQKGITPFNEILKPGEVIVRLIPDSPDKSMEPYDTKLTLVAGVETVVKYDFGSTSKLSSGEIISFEKNPAKETSLVVISLPDFASVIIDGREKSTTPFKTSSITPGDHTVEISAAGFAPRTTKVKAHSGYKLTLIVKLAKTDVSTPLPSPTAVIQNSNRQEVEILPTSVGYLRVRNQPSSLADEIAQVQPGKRYPYVSTDEKTGWFEIEYASSDSEGKPGKNGWVSNQYAKLIKPDEDKSATSSAKLSTPTPTNNPAT